MNNIKIVYSWIGPKGPIMNTELPNILCFANVTTDVTVNSQKFWADGLYHSVFLNTEPYQLASTIDINENDTFIYPFTLAWRHSMTTYFTPFNGILEYSHTPDNIIHQVRTHKGYFLLEYAVEAFIRPDHLSLIHTYFKNYDIPLCKVIYITGCMNALERYEVWCQQNGIPDTPKDRIKLVSYPTSRYNLASHMLNNTEPNYNTEFVPDKLFLSWNRRFRPHRTILTLALDKLGIVDRSYFSMGRNDPEFGDQLFENNLWVNVYSHNMFNLTVEDLNKLLVKLPLIVDGKTEIHDMCIDSLSEARTFYQNSLISIVTETNFDLEEVTLTEKAFKPAKEKHPFILVGGQGSLKAMRDEGFMTFGQFWDESYDNITDWQQRLHKIIEIAEQISKWNDEQIIDFKRKVQPILDYNYNVLKTSSTKHVAEKIKNLIGNT